MKTSADLRIGQEVGYCVDYGGYLGDTGYGVIVKITRSGRVYLDNYMVFTKDLVQEDAFKPRKLVDAVWLKRVEKILPRRTRKQVAFDLQKILLAGASYYGPRLNKQTKADLIQLIEEL